MDAIVDLVRAGEIAPSASDVAARAGVGLRSVFRHFKDMESLYCEMTVVIEAEMRAAAAQPFKGATWRERVLEIVDRRSVGFEAVGPILLASGLRRHDSPVLQDDHARMVSGLRQILRYHAPPDAVDRQTLEVLDLLLSPESWRRLRHDQLLAPDEARQALRAAVHKLIGGDPVQSP